MIGYEVTTTIKTFKEKDKIELSFSNKKETKSKRVNLLLYPSVHKALEKKLKVVSKDAGRKISINEVVNKLIAEYVGMELNQ